MPPLTLTETLIPFSVDSPWFCDFDFDFGGAFAGHRGGRFGGQFGAVDAGADQAEPVHAAGVAAAARAADRAERRADFAFVEPRGPVGEEDALRHVGALDPVGGEHAVDLRPHHRRVEHVAAEQLLHLRWRCSCVACSAPTSPSAVLIFSAISFIALAAQLVDQLERVLGVAHVAGRAEAVDAAGVVVHRAAVGVDLVDEFGHREAAGFVELVEEGLAGLVGLFDDLGDVAGVVAQRPVLARVEAALDPEHDQDQQQQAAAEREPAAQQDLLTFGATARPWPSTRPGCGGILQEAGSMSQEEADSRRSRESALVGSLVLNRFLIERRIGSGGFGTVYEAWDGRLERPVAVKAIESAGAPGSDRVLREAQAAARLNHPGIVTLYEMGEEDGNALLVTELVDGSTLAQLNRDGTLSDREIGEIGADLCEALDHAHCRAVVHRDIKPQNVLVTEGGEPRAKLMDFGVARLADAAALTAPGDVVGTLAYMAPEQAEGRTAGPEADVYSLAPDALRVLERRAPDPPLDPGGDGAGDRRPPAPAAPAAPRPAARALRRRSTPACRPARIAGPPLEELGERDRKLARPPRRAAAAQRARAAPAPRRDRRSPPPWVPGSPSVTASCSRRIRAGLPRQPARLAPRSRKGATDQRSTQPRESDRRPRRGGLQPRLQLRGAAGRAGPQAGQGDGRPQDRRRSPASTCPTSTPSSSPSKDRVKLEGYERSLEQELSGYLLEHARRRDYDLLTRPGGRVQDRRAPAARRVRHPDPAGQAAGARGRGAAPGRGGPHDGLLGGQGATGRGGRAPSSGPKRWSPPAPSSRSTTAATCSRGRGRRSVAPRSAECVLSDPNVSRRHAELRRSQTGDWTIADLGSTNGIKVNGRRVSSLAAQPRRPGDASAPRPSCSTSSSERRAR